MNIQTILNKTHNPVLVKATIKTDIQSALQQFFEIKEEMDDGCNDWPYHNLAATVESFFDIEEINGSEVLFSISVYFGEFYTKNAVTYIKWLFIKKLGDLFNATELYHNAK